MAAEAIFHRAGTGLYEPTEAAVGPWDDRFVHGAAAAALLAGRMVPDEGTLGRLTIDLLAPVPMAALTFERSAPSGGSRVQRHEGVLSSDGRVVARASAVAVRRTELDLPEAARRHGSPFDPSDAPGLDEPDRRIAEAVGHDSFDSRSVVLRRLRVAGDRRVHFWVALAVPVVDDETPHGVEVAAVAADYAQAAVSGQLPFDTWSFRNAELTLHLSRAPAGRWVGMRCESLVQPVGAGFNAADLFDAAGWCGRSAATIVIERRATPPGAARG